MDDPALPERDLDAALRGLARLNRASRSWRAFAPVLRRACEGLRRSVRVLDVACGGGDNLVRLGRWADRAGVAVELCGVDRSPVALADAAELADDFDQCIDWKPLDVLAGPLPAGFDVVTCHLFLHHLDEPDAVSLLGRMKAAAGSAVVVNDLRRGRLNCLAVWVGSRLLTRSPVVHFDAPASVRAAFTAAELAALAESAGLTGVTVRAVPPCRLRLVWERK
jgi:2-polyprenyl-3-methyl-5-hydroxy-6-metoxy-1,4-benzoquinol methylase